MDHNESFHSHDDIHREDLWYSSTELKQFRVNFKSEAKAFRIIESEQQQQQQHDNNDSSSSSSYAQVMERVYETCCLYATEVSQPTVEAHDAQQLRAWVRVTDSRWGLERLCVRSIAQDKMARRQDLYDIIVEDTSFLQQSMSAESLAEACRTISRGSRYFATLLGQAQACALDA